MTKPVKNPSKRGRKPIMNRHKLALLVEAFKNGATVGQAMKLANINKDAYYNALKDPKINDKIEYAKNEASIISKKNIVNDIRKGNVDTSKWWSERREPNLFAPKQQKEVTNVNIIGYITQKEAKTLENKQVIEGEVIE